MNILEKDIESLIYEALLQSPKILEERGLSLYPNCFRQLKMGNYGISDLICYKVDKSYPGCWSIRIQIVELKKELVDVSTLMQAARYETSIRRFFETSGRRIQKVHLDIDYILIGKEIQNSGDFVFLLNGIGRYKVRAYTYELDMVKGLVFHEQAGWYKNQEGFNGFENEVLDPFTDVFRTSVLAIQKREQMKKDNLKLLEM